MSKEIGKHEKSGNQNNTANKVILVTAILKLIETLVSLIEKLLE